MKTIFTFLFFNLLPFLAFSATDSLRVVEHLENITKRPDFRNYQNTQALDSVAQYIFEEFSQYSEEVGYQEYDANESSYRNVICDFGPKDAPMIVVGAHYDVCGDQEGADDNASGVVGLLELARQLKDSTLKYRIELVAYTLEEPPYFRSDKMGSYVHAKSLHDDSIEVYGMISLEMIGYFTEVKKSQQYPVFFLSWFYGDVGDYITIVSKFGKGKFGRKFSSLFKRQKLIKTKSFAGPTFLPGIDFSDHLNYWLFGYSALMITDTSFYRNHNYHQKTDVMSTLDIKKMCAVIDNTFATLVSMK